MLTKKLHSNWTFSELKSHKSFSAEVPGNIHTDLLNNKQIPDPFFGINEKEIQWVEKKDWEYKNIFDIDESLINKDKIELVFEGLDTYSEIILNGVHILSTDNMFRKWIVDIKPFLKLGENTLIVKFFNVFDKSTDIIENDKIPRTTAFNNDQSEFRVGFYHRKAQFHFGWDWGPRFVTCGIWRPVYIQAYNTFRFDSVFIKQDEVNQGKAELNILCEINSVETQLIEIEFEVEGTGITKNFNTELLKGDNNISGKLEIENPYLWWPNGYGSQHLYKFNISIKAVNGETQSKAVTTGLRKIEFIRDEDEFGTSFYFKINGIPVFIKGANYIPADSFQNRVSYNDYKFLIESAQEANMNMLRVWGGGIYESDEFYKLCDEKGILVWQDFIFACNMYPGNDEYLKSVYREAVDNIKRIRNHCSLSIYCGNNENEIAWHNWGWQNGMSEEQKSLYEKEYEALFLKTLPAAVRKADDSRAYIPTSPLVGFGDNDYSKGDAHYWGVWHEQKPFEEFENNVARFMSEYGFQSYPDINSVKLFADEENRFLKSDVMKSHQRCMQDEGRDKEFGNRLIESYMDKYFNKPKDFESYLYVSQVLQADGISKAIETHRKNKPFCMGTLYWQLNDCWPVASWAGIDYYKSWKALHFHVKKLYREFLIIPEISGTEFNIFISSDNRQLREGVLEYSIMNFDGEIILEDTIPVNIQKLSSKIYASFNKNDLLKGTEAGNRLMQIVLKIDGETLSEKIFYFEKPKELKLKKTGIKLKRIRDKEISLKSDTLAKNVFIYVDDIEGRIFSDNYFDLLPGEEKIVSIIQSDRIAGKEIKIKSLIDSF